MYIQFREMTNIILTMDELEGGELEEEAASSR